MDPILVPNLDNPKKRDKIEKDKNAKAQQRFNLLKERLNAIEGVNIHGGMDAAELSLVSDLVILLKLKTLEFKMYCGANFPSTHLMMYY